MEYIGDDTFDEYLRGLDFPLILPEIKTVILRCHFAIDMLPMQKFFDEVMEGYRFKDETGYRDFVGQLMALWNVLAAHQNEGAYFRFVRFPKPESVDDLRTRIYVRNLEIKRLVPLLAEPIPERYAEEYRLIIAPLQDAIGLTGDVLKCLGQPHKDGMLVKWAKDLDKNDVVLEEVFNQLGWMLVRVRRDDMWDGMAAVDEQVVRGPKVGRNEPCPCGSGKKYKHCCLDKNGD